MISNAKLITEMLDVTAGINGLYSYGSFIEDVTFCSSIASIGHKYMDGKSSSLLFRLCLLSVHHIMLESIAFS